MRLDIIFINATSAVSSYQDLCVEHTATEHNIWAGMLANHCRSKNFSVKIIDCDAERLSNKEAAERIKYENPRIACFVVYKPPNAASQSMEGALALANELKSISDITTLFVGAHVSALPQEVLAYDCIDFICQNEGVYTITNLLLDTNFSSLDKINGLGYKKDGQQILNTIGSIVPQASLEQELPGIAWDLMPPPTSYRTAGWHSWTNNSIKTPFASIYTSLGCIFKCNFCMINITNRTDNTPGVSADKSAIFRYWKPEFIIQEFDKLAKMGVKNIRIADEMFVLKPSHFMEICRLLIERDYGFNLWAYCRVDTCKDEYLDTLKKAGINWLALGIESPNQSVRQNMTKGGYKELKIPEIIKTITKHGINVAANYIVGLPLDTHETMQQTMDFAIEMCTPNINLYCCVPYAGSALYYQAKEKGWKLPDRYAAYAQHSYYFQPLPTEYLTATEVLKFRDEAWFNYHSNPKYLNMLENKFGIGARMNVESMLGVKLKRKLLENVV